MQPEKHYLIEQILCYDDSCRFTGRAAQHDDDILNEVMLTVLMAGVATRLSFDKRLF